MTEAFRHRFTVTLADTDAAGILFFAHLFRHAHDAYEAFMAGLGLPLPALIAEGGSALPLVHAEADYKRPLRHGEAVEVLLELRRVGEGSFTVAYRFFGPDGSLRAEATTVHAHIDRRSGTKAPLPEKLRLTLAGTASTASSD